MAGRNRQCIIELNVLRARVEIALRRAEQAVLRSGERLDSASERLVAAHHLVNSWRTAADGNPGTPRR